NMIATKLTTPTPLRPRVSSRRATPRRRRRRRRLPGAAMNQKILLAAKTTAHAPRPSSRRLARLPPLVKPPSCFCQAKLPRQPPVRKSFRRASRAAISRAMSRVLVTGATGFVGRALVPALAAAHRVALAVRSRSETVAPGTEQREIGEIGPDTDWRRAL